jgi:hypothetical protein
MTVFALKHMTHNHVKWWVFTKSNDLSAHEISLSPFKIDWNLNEVERDYAAPERRRVKEEICVMLLDTLLKKL